MKLRNLFLLAVTIVVMASCSFEKIGRNAAKGFTSDLEPTVDSIGRTLVSSVRTELTSDSSRQQLQAFIDSLLAPVFTGIRNTIGSSRDSIFNEQTLAWIDSMVQAITGERLNRNLMALQGALLGKTKADIYEIERSVQLMLNAILADALGDSTRMRVALLRDELLGPKTSSAISKIMDTAVLRVLDTALARFSVSLRTDVDPFVKGNVSFIRKNAEILLASLAGLAALIILLVWLNRRKYLRMVAMLAKQIDSIPDKQVYDYVTHKIQNEAVTAGLEPALRGVLKQNGLLGSESWKKNATGPS